MKKIISVLLAALMCFSFTACGENEPRNDTDIQKETAITQTEDTKDEIERSSNGVACLTKEQAKPYISRVELTMDNWQQYFDNHSVPYHYERCNEFGDIEDSWDGVYRYFGVAGYDVVIYDSVAFKSMHYIDYYSNGRNDRNVQEYTSWERYIDADGGAWLSRYPTGTQAEKWDSVTPPEAGYYKASDFDYTSSLHYFEITDVTGSIIVMDFPDELWTEINGHSYIVVDSENFVRNAELPDGVAVKETGSYYNHLVD